MYLICHETIGVFKEHKMKPHFKIKHAKSVHNSQKQELQERTDLNTILVLKSLSTLIYNIRSIVNCVRIFALLVKQVVSRLLATLSIIANLN